MAEYHWEPKWRSRELPEVGDYIQVRAHSIWNTEDRSTKEGLVTSVIGQHLCLNGDTEYSRGWVAICWRKRIVPIETEIVEVATLGSPFVRKIRVH
jgi:hypothetical protein